MQTRFRPSLETLGDRVCPTPWDPTTGQTRQITMIQDMSPPDDEFAVRVAPTSGPAGDSFYGTGVYKSVDSGRTW